MGQVISSFHVTLFLSLPSQNYLEFRILTYFHFSTTTSLWNQLCTFLEIGDNPALWKLLTFQLQKHLEEASTMDSTVVKILLLFNSMITVKYFTERCTALTVKSAPSSWFPL